MFIIFVCILVALPFTDASDVTGTESPADFNISEFPGRSLQQVWSPDNKPRTPMCPAGYVDRTTGCAFWWKCAINCPGTVSQRWAAVDCSCACVRPEEKDNLPPLLCPGSTTSPPYWGRSDSLPPTPAPPRPAPFTRTLAPTQAPTPVRTPVPTPTPAPGSGFLPRRPTLAPAPAPPKRSWLRVTPSPTPGPAVGNHANDVEDDSSGIISTELIVALAVFPSLMCCMFCACLAFYLWKGRKLSRVHVAQPRDAWSSTVRYIDHTVTEIQSPSVPQVSNVEPQPAVSYPGHHLTPDWSSAGKLSPRPISSSSTRPPSPTPSSQSFRSQSSSTRTASPGPKGDVPGAAHGGRRPSTDSTATGSSAASVTSAWVPAPNGGLLHAARRAASAHGRRPSSDSTASAGSRTSSQPSRTSSQRPSTSPCPSTRTVSAAASPLRCQATLN